MKKILVAGLGNIFHGDDAFGCEVIRAARIGQFGAGVDTIDFGIRSYDLAYALASDYETIILVDAVSRGGPPGKLYLIEPETETLGKSGTVDAHEMNPIAVIQMAQCVGVVKAKILLVGCEPAVLESDKGELGLSEQVQAAVPAALKMIEDLVRDLREGPEKVAAELESV